MKRPAAWRCTLRWGRAAIAAAVLLVTANAFGSVAFLLEQPYGLFGGINPTGHAAVYLSEVCAESPTRLRMCHSGEYGVVVSRYHRVGGYDWIAVPLIPYLYAVDKETEIPDWVDEADVADLRNEYRKANYRDMVPDVAGSDIPGGDWTQLVGSAYDRTLHGFQIATTAEQDRRLVALLNDRKNVAHFNLLFRNCADFAKMVMNTYYPHSVHRSIVADLGITTPKQVARSVVKYGKKHPEVELSAFVIPQVDGTVKRSHKVDGVAESLVKSKKYLIPLTILSPEVTGAAVLAYLVKGRLDIPKDAPVFDLDEAEVTPAEAAAARKGEPTVVGVKLDVPAVTTPVVASPSVVPAAGVGVGQN